MWNRLFTRHPSRLHTTGDQSPGIVWGNYTINAGVKAGEAALKDAFKVRLEVNPSDRGYFIDFENDKKIFVNGCKFELVFANAGTIDLLLRTFRLSVAVSDMTTPRIPEKERRYGRAISAHRLFVELYRDAALGWWLLWEGTNFSEPRKFIDARGDMLDSPPSPRLQFRLTPGEMEFIQGGLIPQEFCLFRVKFIFGLITATESLFHATEEILIVKGTADGS
jgi:hypothetical protein